MQDTTLITGKKYVKDIFGNEQFYNIPEYQRPYVWGEEQINNFLDDINNSWENNKEKEYFLGCMIWNTKEELSENGKYKTQDILDGQQRFLTLFLLHVVIRNLSNDDETKSSIQDRLVQKAKKFEGIPQRNRVEFEIRDDKDFIDKYLINEVKLDYPLLDKIINNTQSGTSVRNLAGGIKIMLKWFNNKKNTYGDEFQNFLNEYYIYLSIKVLALYLATPNNLDDAYNLFTVLNSRGLQLQASDILRAQNLRVIQDDKVRRRYAEKWDDFENKITLPYDSIDEFLWTIIFIKMKYRSDDNQSIPKAFDYMYSRGIISKGVETIDLVENYLKHFVELSNVNTFYNDKSGYLFNNLNSILSTVYGSQYLAPILFFKETFGECYIVDFLIKIDNLYSMAWLLGKRQTMTRTFNILKKISFYGDKVKQNLLSIENAAYNMLNDYCLNYDYHDDSFSAEKPLDINEFEKVLLENNWGTINGVRVNKVKYLLLKLDVLRGSKNNIIHFNKQAASLEHLMPQNISKTEWNIEPDFHKEWVHKLGNLVLLDKIKNSSLSNQTFSKKREKYKGAIESRAYTNHIFMNYKEWNEYTIMDNHESVVKLLMDYYRGNSVETFLEIQRNLSKYNPKQFV